jgi:hypothetical protein
MMSTLSWELVALASAAQGIIFYVNPQGAMFTGICWGVYFTIRLWLVEYPLTVYYDIRLFVVLLTVGVLSTMIYGLLCWGTSFEPIPHGTCQGYNIWGVVKVQIFSLMVLSLLFWGFFRIRIWWALK